MSGRCLMRLSVLAVASLAAWPCSAAPTTITVHVLSKDAKFVGTSMGGARVVIRDAETQEILAQGLTTGGTGDTTRIMKEPWRRGEPISTPDAAKFTAVIDLDAPRRIEVTAFGPMAQPQTGARASATQWVVPGRNIDAGDAFLLVLPGFSLDVLQPATHARFSGVPQPVTLRANLTML